MAKPNQRIYDGIISILKDAPNGELRMPAVRDRLEVKLQRKFGSSSAIYHYFNGLVDQGRITKEKSGRHTSVKLTKFGAR